ncbi:asparagine synthetase B [Litchfieldella qijiaojingensis]|uniref:asparagine synthase (glutamine-hydrolyzing) n=1 Tax=Litchfieldella qijiaojingensis TaxID=980347 RepID=A0ABQ2YDH1_9GAMM|nr:asparagine synthetase B [Halomonas qijiaojingensis]GGX80275.1 asparagine synthetase B [Halomonas qijiaojingensis]
MSGVCGIIHLDGEPVDRGVLERMANQAAYRGPGGVHYHCEGAVGIACLSLDTTADGSGACRPVIARGHSLVFAADARLDNRDECAEVFLVHSAEISSGVGAAEGPPSDAELMLGALLHDGERGPAFLIGDFAYALWDESRRELRLARDGMGMRSLYYKVESKRILFATEIKQILAVGGVPRKLNEQAVAWYLAGMQVPAGCVFYEGIEEVKPGEEVVIDSQTRVRQRIFWRPDPDNRIRYRDEREYADHLRELLVEAMRCRLRARSPVGVSLSGGMDSATIASIAGWLGERGEDVPAIRAYSWAFTDFPECDERANIYRITDRYQIPTHEIPAEETYPLVDYAAYTPHEDDPFTSMFQAFIARGVSTALADRAAVMFYGFRGDMMGGGNVSDVPGMLRAGLFGDARGELARLSRKFSFSKVSTISHYVLRPVASDLIPRQFIISGRRASQRLRPLVTREHHGEDRAIRVGPAERAVEHVRESFLRRAGLPLCDPVSLEAETWPGSAGRQRYVHVFSPLVMRGVMYAERLCAGYGIGFADPWSDRRIAEFMLACPQHWISRSTEVKRLPRHAMQGIMPPDAIKASRKVSPEPFYLHALREKAYDNVIDLMTGSCCAELGYIDEVALRERFERFKRGDAPVFDLWSTLSLEIWLRRYWS